MWAPSIASDDDDGKEENIKIVRQDVSVALEKVTNVSQPVNPATNLIASITTDKHKPDEHNQHNALAQLPAIHPQVDNHKQLGK